VPNRALAAPKRWRSPDELVELGFTRSRVVMMNELHDGLRRCVRTREIGRRILPAAHAAGVRHLAMEALYREFAAEANASRAVPSCPGGYLAQPDMRELIAAALELGWTLIAYEAQLEGSTDPGDWERINRREEEQARNLVAALAEVPPDAKLLVWCGNSHLSRHRSGEWTPMGLCFAELAGFDAFALDQTQGIGEASAGSALADRFADELEARGGAAGFLADDHPLSWFGVDAVLLSTDNELS
jgi:erythromycin esterase-like protein